MHSDHVPRVAYAIGGQQWVKDAPGFAEAIAQAFEQRLRPCCLCRKNPDGQGIEMYVARLLEGYTVKRMPNTGSLHAPHCPSYEPPPERSGLGPLLGTAIVENPSTGQTALKLDFSMLKMPGRCAAPVASATHSSVATAGHQLSLRGLLHYLWDQAELTHWQPGFAGKRSWGTVRKHLLLAASNKTARGDALSARLYIPEVFSVDQREAINARRWAQWSHGVAAPHQPQHLMLLIAEVKAIGPARCGFKAVVKHVPDQAFLLDATLFRRMTKHFDSALALWAATDSLHLVIIATFSVSAAGCPTLVELSLMPVDRCWLPVENGFEQQLMERLVKEGRSFVKGLRYNQDTASALASATLTDGEEPAPPLWIGPQGAESERDGETPRPLRPAWRWNPVSEAMPPLPPRQLHASDPASTRSGCPVPDPLSNPPAGTP